MFTRELRLFCLSVVALLGLVATVLLRGSAVRYEVLVNDEPAVDRLSVLAGNYGSERSGQWSGDSIRINADGTYQHEAGGCGPHDLSAGRVRAMLDKVFLRKTKATRTRLDGFGRDAGLPAFLYIVPWDDRTYLIADRDMHRFCLNAQKPIFRKSDWWQPYLRDRDIDKSVEGMPKLPKRWAGFFETFPHNGNVVSHPLPELVEVDLGRVDGIVEGAVFYSDSRRRNRFVVSKVFERSSIAMVPLGGDAAIGQPVTTDPPSGKPLSSDDRGGTPSSCESPESSLCL